MLFDHYLAVVRWTPDFASPLAKVKKTLLWILFSGLNLLYYDESIFLDLASVMGTHVKVNVNGHWYNVQYEGLHIICSNCSCYGHHTCDCKKTPHDLTRTVIPTVAQPRGLPKNDDVYEQRLIELYYKVDDDGAKIVAKDFREINTVHDDWLVVQRKNRNK
ncbi:unnamed protein product [Vicia faba]|uniref:DUF4283 domain-containing protein n=1 Tax=Vicia faba TaxID=3906 RepID=A0AAV1AVK6_VICFA|nr:unnamed protein product [Vicia faba]